MSDSDSTPPPSYGSDFWDNRYGTAGTDYVFGTAPNDFLAACASSLPPQSKVLCLAEGEGRNAVHLARLGHTVTAVDQSATGLAKARELAAQHGVSITTLTADLATFTIAPGAWDAVVSIFCHLPPDLRRQVHARAAAGLRPGGHLILEAYTPEQLNHRTGGPINNPPLLMRRAEIVTEFPGLTWLTAQEIERDVVEGTGHTGRAAVLQLHGQRPSA
ncbi:SAM-dependent methyltransferase [Actomonas aquatica]|uniref:Class I SAM-dependent methyltransferase n=1 Tax=Actomonas aquatica TaxID=2866162 RepID=A0ABZ1C467_9BACT|nr:class I SAM-dependent methyltransferase [Opitutus sp. WL0086]WRQ86489.1 class I SAM-dependent methyltransferase [Opitutus sp. WL0086]